MKQISKFLIKRSSSEDQRRSDGLPVRFHPPIKSNEINLSDEDKSEKRNLFLSDLNRSFPLNMSKSTTSSSSNENRLISRRSILTELKQKLDEESIVEHRDQILLNLSKENLRFHDETFPSTNQSIFINGFAFSSSTIQFHQLNSPSTTTTTRRRDEEILWLRPEDIRTSSRSDVDQWTIFRDPKPNDVIQGALGDCWFITALSVLAERPEYLVKILTTKEINREGIYFVRLCQDGEWKQVLVDDRFPCRIDRKLIFSQSRRKQLWVPLIEKALAKLNGTYESIVAGRCCEGLSIISGSPCETFYLGSTSNPDEKCLNLDDIWRKLVEWKDHRFLMCAMCANKSIEKKSFDQSGLSNNHAYSIQDFQEFSSRENSNRYRFVKLRNPWGGCQLWKGEDQHLLKQFNLIDENNDQDEENRRRGRGRRRSDGVFWIPFRFFVEYFESVDICKIRPNWYEVRDQGEFRSHSSFIDSFRFELKEKSQLDLTLHRIIEKNQRFLRTNLTLSISVVNLEEQTNDHWRIYSIPIQSQRGQHKFISTSGFLPPGFYYILPFLFDPILVNCPTSNQSTKEENLSFNLSIHSSSPIDLQRCSLPSRIQREFLIKLCLFYGELISTPDGNNSFDDSIRLYQLKNYWDGFILLVENRHLTLNVHFYFHCSQSQNAHLSRKDSQYQTRDVIPPRHRQIILICSRKDPSHTFTLLHQFHWEMSTQNFLKMSSISKMKHWPNIDESNDLHLPQRIQT